MYTQVAPTPFLSSTKMQARAPACFGKAGVCEVFLYESRAFLLFGTTVERTSVITLTVLTHTRRKEPQPR